MLHNREGDKSFGASLSALYLLGRQMNYTMIWAMNPNCYFLRDDLPSVKAYEAAHSLEELHPEIQGMHLEMTPEHAALRVDYLAWSAKNGLPTFGLSPSLVEVN